MDWIDEIIKYIPNELHKFIDIYDLRSNKGRYDDIVLVINKNK